MAISTMGCTLLKENDGGTSYTQLVAIKSFPDLGGAPEMLETTTLSDTMQTYINGIQSADALEFEANYTKTAYLNLLALKDTETNFVVHIGPSGTEGIFKFSGYLSVRVNGGGVNEVVGMTISIAPSSAIIMN